MQSENNKLVVDKKVNDKLNTIKKDELVRLMIQALKEEGFRLI
jgi:hypothetical protein